MSQPPRLFDRARHRLRLDRAAGRYGEAGFLKRRAAEDIVERLGVVRRDFSVAADLGARDGAFAAALAASDVSSKVGLLIETDLSAAMLAGGRVRIPRLIVADEERLPFADASFDLVVSSLALHWTNDLRRRLLIPDPPGAEAGRACSWRRSSAASSRADRAAPGAFDGGGAGAAGRRGAAGLAVRRRL